MLFLFLFYFSVPNSMYFEPPCINEIVNSILSINVGKAVGHDNIPPFFLKTSAFTVAPEIFILLNYPFQQMASFQKIAKVIPIHKEESS